VESLIRERFRSAGVNATSQYVPCGPLNALVDPWPRRNASPVRRAA
jgi:hypothetical protein